ncbi:hypothetical protein HMPREF1321_0188, partial [Capnocytophaga sp. oral taxon 412 str. F0487]|uniref:hypothetical protein n=1 Tax=Capnocytophaga sp. oral taxon 412 TaxID=712218 RepID=UPI00026975BE
MDYNEGQDFFYRDWKQINDPKVKLYAFQGQGEGEYLVYSLQQILDFLRSNKNKEVNFPPAKQDYNLEKYSSETRLDEYFTNKENKKVKIVGLYCNDKKGKLNLSTVGNIVGRTGYSVEFNEYNAVFSMYVYYAQGKEPAITIKTKGYHALKEILNYIGFEITGESKRHIAKLYKEAFGKAGYDYNKIDALLEDIPSFIISELSDETLWKYLQSLSKGSIDKAGTNEESAIFNVINSFKDDKYLYNQLYNHQEVVYDLYSGIDGDNVMRYLNKLLQLTDKYSKAEEQSLRHFCFLGLFKTGDYRFFTEIKNIKEHNRSKFIKSWKVTVLNKGIPSELDVSDLSNFSKENLLDVATVYLYKNSTTPKVDVLPIIYIYHLSKEQNQEDLLKTIEIASNFLGVYGASRGLFVKGASVILKTAATIEIVNLSLNAYMQNESHRKEIENMGAGGKWFVENWSTISTLTDLATFSVAILDDLPKVSAKLQKEGVDTKELDTFVEKARREVGKRTAELEKQTLSLLSSLKNSKIEKLVKSWDKTLQEALEKDLLSKSTGGELRQLLKTEDDFLKWKLIKEDPAYAFEISKTDITWTKWGKSNFFKTNTQLGRQFESLVSSKIRNISPFSTLYKDYTHLKQVYLKGVKDNIIADDLFVKELRDERGRSYFKAIISDSKLKATSPWTANQKSELIDVFKNNPNKKYIEFEVRSDKLPINSPIKKTDKIRIYREDVYKIISEGDNIKIPPIQMF